MKSAEQGNPIAQRNVGLMYSSGDGVQASEANAFVWFKKAAEQGYSRAQVNLGYQYMKGYGTPKDVSKAFVWFQKAAEQDDPEGEYSLAMLYTGQQGGIPADDSLAFYWFSQAANQGNVNAQAYLGYYYLNGLGVNKDPQKAAFGIKLPLQKAIRKQRCKLDNYCLLGQASIKIISKPLIGLVNLLFKVMFLVKQN